MLETMRELALLELNRRFGSDGRILPMPEFRREHGASLPSLLVEAAEKIPRVYLLQKDPRQQWVVRMWSEEMSEDRVGRLPFNRPSGSQSGAIGPVLKRSYKKGESPPYGPSDKIQETTRKIFAEIAAGTAPWSGYFAEMIALLFGPAILDYASTLHSTGPGCDFSHPLASALALIPETTTVFVAAVDGQGRWPGDRPEYQEYLARTLADSKYVTVAAPVQEHGACPLCDAQDVTLYPNAVKGAGINIGNMDRIGAFPGLDAAQAWKGYALCVDCADLLYIFKFHLSGDYLGWVAGERALLLPALVGHPEGRQRFIEDWADYLAQINKQDTGTLGDIEEDLMEFYAGREDAQLVLNLLWANFGQLIDDCRGHLTDILPSRLRALSGIDAEVNRWSHALAPHEPMSEAKFRLDLDCLGPLLKRPGGKAAKAANASPRLFALKRDLAEAVYHARPLADPGPLWEELLTTARWYLREVTLSGNAWGLTCEGVNKKGQRYWTLAGWIRHLARFLHYLYKTGVMPMTTDAPPFVPHMEALQPFFAPGSGLDRPEKAFTFLLGVLYGKLLQVQAARGVNVGANALTWLKRLNLSGQDLPGLYTRIREKLMSYETESNAAVRELVAELGRLGAQLGDRIELDTTATCYFLLLGQSVVQDVLPSKSKENGDQTP